MNIERELQDQGELTEEERQEFILQYMNIEREQQDQGELREEERQERAGEETPQDFEEEAREEARNFFNHSRNFTFELIIENSTPGLISHSPITTHLAFCTGQCNQESYQQFLALINGGATATQRAYIVDTTERQFIHQRIPPLQIQVESRVEPRQQDPVTNPEPGTVVGRIQSLNNWDTDEQDVCLKELKRTLNLNLQGIKELLRNVNWETQSRDQIASSDLALFVKHFLPKEILEEVQLELQCHPLDRRLCTDPIEKLALVNKLLLTVHNTQGLGLRALQFIRRRILLVKKLVRYRIQKAATAFCNKHIELLSWLDLVYLDTAVSFFIDLNFLWLGLIVNQKIVSLFEEKLELHQLIEKLFFFPVQWTWKSFDYTKIGAQLYFWTPELDNINYFSNRILQNITGTFTETNQVCPTLEFFQNNIDNFIPEKVAFSRAVTVPIKNLDYRINQRIRFVTEYWNRHGYFAVARRTSFPYPRGLSQNPLEELTADIGAFIGLRNTPELVVHDNGEIYEQVD